MAAGRPFIGVPIARGACNSALMGYGLFAVDISAQNQLWHARSNVNCLWTDRLFSPPRPEIQRSQANHKGWLVTWFKYEPIEAATPSETKRVLEERKEAGTKPLRLGIPTVAQWR